MALGMLQRGAQLLRSVGVEARVQVLAGLAAQPVRRDVFRFRPFAIKVLNGAPAPSLESAGNIARARARQREGSSRFQTWRGVGGSLLR